VFRDQGYLETLRFVREGRISETSLNEKVRRILRMKQRRGLFESALVSPENADAVVGNPDAVALADEVARRACIMVRSGKGVLPLSPGQRIAVIEQRIAARNIPNTPAHHRLSFCEAMYGHSANITGTDTEMVATADDREFVLSAVHDVDTVVMTNYYARSQGSNQALCSDLLRAGKRLVLVTNTPYPTAVVDGAEAVLCTFSTNAASLRAAADILFGKSEAGGTWPLRHYSDET
jgi:beta-N-acetylhexosaminidase